MNKICKILCILAVVAFVGFTIIAAITIPSDTIQQDTCHMLGGVLLKSEYGPACIDPKAVNK